MRAYTVKRKKMLAKNELWSVRLAKAVKADSAEAKEEAKAEKEAGHKLLLDFYPGLSRIAAGHYDLKFDSKQSVFKRVPELIALRAQESGEFEITLEGEIEEAPRGPLENEQ